MTGPTLPERLRDAGLSTWELGDLLGIHPHLVSGSHGQPAMRTWMRATAAGTSLTFSDLSVAHPNSRALMV